mgnify:CR=1 FL=1
MLVYDKKLLECGGDIISSFDRDRVTNIGYDLSTEKYTVGEKMENTSVKLMPYESAFVMSRESIKLPNDLIARVVLRNSRIRQGLTLDAPIYQPGHETKVFYRITNISDKEINLDERDEFATIIFEKLDGEVEKKYSGTFQKEFDYRGMGDYSSIYIRELDEINDKISSIKDVEKHIYGNVLAIMAVFVGVFSLLNLNVSFGGFGLDTKALLILNLAMCGSVSLMMGIVDNVVNNSKHKFLWGVSALCFVIALMIQALL